MHQQFYITFAVTLAVYDKTSNLFRKCHNIFSVWFLKPIVSCWMSALLCPFFPSPKFSIVEFELEESLCVGPAQFVLYGIIKRCFYVSKSLWSSRYNGHVCRDLLLLLLRGAAKNNARSNHILQTGLSSVISECHSSGGLLDQLIL